MNHGKGSQPLLETVPLRGAVSVAIRQFSQAAFTYPWHRHPEVELTWILEGAGLRYVGDSVAPFGAGDFCVIGANLPHAWLSTGAGRKGRNRRARSFVVQFDPHKLGGLIGTVPELADVVRLLERAQRGLQYPPAVGERIRARLLQASNPLARLTTLLDALGGLAGEPGGKPLSLVPWSRESSAHSETRLRAVLTYLHAHAEEAVSHAHCARLAGLSPSAFSRFFRRAMGRTFQTYLTDLRLSLACRRLFTTELSISEIAYATGFGNLSNFNRSFRLRRGMAPREYRRQAVSA